ncbi:hypothetical protein BGX31_011014 [Mortierella sp. GBA43]|nr:hypothetical protein BGX31_011014 [Mortierella sp. GBA43]
MEWLRLASGHDLLRNMKNMPSIKPVDNARFLSFAEAGRYQNVYQSHQVDQIPAIPDSDSLVSILRELTFRTGHSQPADIIHIPNIGTLTSDAVPLLSHIHITKEFATSLHLALEWIAFSVTDGRDWDFRVYLMTKLTDEGGLYEKLFHLDFG